MAYFLESISISSYLCRYCQLADRINVKLAEWPAYTVDVCQGERQLKSECQDSICCVVIGFAPFDFFGVEYDSYAKY